MFQYPADLPLGFVKAGYRGCVVLDDFPKIPQAFLVADDSPVRIGKLLLAATAQGRCVFTLNIRDSAVLARDHPRHGGIFLAAQASWTLSELFLALDRLLLETEAEEWTGQVRWLNDWRRQG